MAGVFWIVTFLVVLFIGLVTVTAASNRLAVEPRMSVYDLSEAIEFVASRLPEEVSARITYEDVHAILDAHLGLLEGAGVAAQVGRDLPEGPPRVIDDDETVARVLQKLDGQLEDVLDEDIALVLEVEAEYVEAIGALGPVAIAEEGGPPSC